MGWSVSLTQGIKGGLGPPTKIVRMDPFLAFEPGKKKFGRKTTASPTPWFFIFMGDFLF